MGYSEVVSTAALVLALFLAVRTGRQDRAVISVKGDQWSGGIGTSEREKISFRVQVLNTGNHATDILSAFWLIERKGLPDEKMPASHGGNGFDSFFTGPHGSYEPTIPFTLGRNTQETWTFEVALDGLRDHQAITRMRPAVTVLSRKDDKTVSGAWLKPTFLEA